MMSAAEYINSFSKSGKRVTDLSRIKKLLELLGNPQNGLKFVHIAGTNGKGSTLELCSQAVINSGYRVGQLTSPFILCYEDRIRINGENISSKALESLCGTVKQAVNNKEYSQFEITFAVALLYFSERECDIVFLETGIGGLLDATNIIKRPLVCVITSISYDHMDLLGNSLGEIAYHKAGIIKQECPVVVSADNSNESLQVIEMTAKEKNAMLIKVKFDDIKIEEYGINGSRFLYNEYLYKLKMLGRHQVFNACTAIEVIYVLRKKGFIIDDENIRQSFEDVQVGARLEIVSKDPLIIIDGGHNEAGIHVLVEVLKKIERKPIIAVAGFLSTKDYINTSNILAEMADAVICVDGFLDNSVDSRKLAECFYGMEHYSMDFRQGFEFAIRLLQKRGGMVVVCGSLYLASEIKSVYFNR